MSKKITAMLLATGLAVLGDPVAAQENGQPTPPPVVRPPLSAEGAAAVRGINAFAVDLYKAKLSPSDNLSLSPASVSTAIGLAYRGAQGRTADEIAATLHYPAGPRDYGAANGEVLRSLQLHAGARVVNIANALWIQQGMTVQADYLAAMQSAYGAVLNAADFRTYPDAARLNINAWVEAQTGNRIRDLLKPADVTDSTRVILVNTIYLKAPWETPFVANATRDQPFTMLDGTRRQTPLMARQAFFRTIKRAGVQAIALPWEGRELEMIVLLPKSHAGLPRLEKALTAESVGQWIERLNHAAPVDTKKTHPRFRLTWRGDLVPVLRTMVMPTALSNAADFGAMKVFCPAGPTDEDYALKIGSVIHQTFLEVLQTGTVA